MFARAICLCMPAQLSLYSTQCSPHYPTGEYDMLFYNFQLRAHAQTKTGVYWKGQKTQLLQLYQFHIRTRIMNGRIQTFSDAGFAMHFRIIRHFRQSDHFSVQFRSDNRDTTVFPYHMKN